MKNLFSLLVIASLLVAPLLATTQKTSATILVGAASSLTDVMEELAHTYETGNPGLKLIVTYGSSGSLQKQIEQGAPIDVFISASPKQVDALESEGLLLEGSKKDLVINNLVLVTPFGNNTVKGFSTLASGEFSSLAIGEPNSVPAGKYADQTLSYLGLKTKVQKNLIYTKDVRQVLAYIASDAVDAGFVYSTDALSTGDVQVVAIAPRESHDPIIYPAAVIKDSRSITAALAFIAWLSGAKAQGIFTEFGFSSP